MSDSVQPNRRQPTRLCHPWKSPGKNSGVVAISFSNATMVSHMQIPVLQGKNFFIEGKRGVGGSTVKNKETNPQLFVGCVPVQGLPDSSVGKESACHVPCRRPQFDSWVGNIHWRYRLPSPIFLGFSWGSAGKESACSSGDLHYPWVEKILWRRERLPTPVFWSAEFHGLYSPWAPCQERRASLIPVWLCFGCRELFFLVSWPYLIYLLINFLQIYFAVFLLSAWLLVNVCVLSIILKFAFTAGGRLCIITRGFPNMN